MSSSYAEELREAPGSEAQDTLDPLRGRYPHVASRLEFTLRGWLTDDEEDDDQ